jgi:hypothetical protein
VFSESARDLRDNALGTQPNGDHYSSSPSSVRSLGNSLDLGSALSYRSFQFRRAYAKPPRMNLSPTQIARFFSVILIISLAPAISAADYQPDRNAVLGHLNTILTWYRDSTGNLQPGELPGDAIFQQNVRNLAAQAVQLAFESARAEAALLGPHRSVFKFRAFQPTTPLYKQVPGTEYAWHEALIAIAADAHRGSVRERALAAVVSVYNEYREVVEHQQGTIGDRMEIVLKAPAPESRFQFNDDGLVLIIRYPVLLSRAPEIDDRVTQALVEVMTDEGATKSGIAGTPKIRAAVKG